MKLMGLGVDIRTLAATCLALAIVMPIQDVLAQEGQTLKCTFSDGQVKRLSEGRFTARAASELSFTIGDIDLRSQTAQLITPNGKGELRIVRAIAANHFLEVVTEGFLNMTTVYDPTDSSGRMPAVHSRHFGLLGRPVLTSYSGFCKPIQ